MKRLNGVPIFLSASFPSGERGAPFAPYDIGAIAAAVTAVTQAVLIAGGRLIFGAHPTISPLVLLVAGEVHRPEAVEIYQSRYFEGQIPEETLDLVERGFGKLHWIDTASSRQLGPSLLRMREQMLSTHPFAAGVFIGGMEGVLDEGALLTRLQPMVPRLPLWAPGGAARMLPPSGDEIAERLALGLRSPLFPSLARDIVGALASGGADQS